MIEYRCATLFRELDNLHGGKKSLVVDDVLDVMGVRWYMHHIQQRDVNMYLLDHLNKASELFVHGCPPVTSRKLQETGISVILGGRFLLRFPGVFLCLFF